MVGLGAVREGGSAAAFVALDSTLRSSAQHLLARQSQRLSVLALTNLATLTSDVALQPRIPMPALAAGLEAGKDAAFADLRNMTKSSARSGR